MHRHIDVFDVSFKTLRTPPPLQKEPLFPCTASVPPGGTSVRGEMRVTDDGIEVAHKSTVLMSIDFEQIAGVDAEGLTLTVNLLDGAKAILTFFNEQLRTCAQLRFETVWKAHCEYSSNSSSE